MEGKLSNQKLAIITAYESGYRVVDGNVISPTGLLRKLYEDKNGYYSVGFKLAEKNIKTKFMVHILVAYQKFGEEILKQGIVVRHLDGNSKNNLDSNIAIGTASDNEMDRKPEDRKKRAINASSKKRRFTDLQVEEIRLKYKNGVKYPQLMEEYKIGKGALWYVLNNLYLAKI